MRAWLNTQRSWLVVERLPAFAPELHPVEDLWSSLKAVELANLCGPTLAEVIAQARRGIDRVRHTPASGLLIPASDRPVGLMTSRHRGRLPERPRYRCWVNPPPAHAVRFAQHLAEELTVILEGDLVGVYLHGSGATGCFNPDRSDIDLLVVTRQALSPEQRRAVAKLLLASSGAPYPVELSLLTTGQLHPWRRPTPFEFHYRESWRASLAQQLADGELSSRELTDPDLAADITVVRARGRVLVGAPIDEVFPEVPEADFRQVILADLDWIRHHSTTIYGVLNTCRILAYLDGQGLLSKTEGADWALGNLPATYRATITKARSAYRNGSDEPCAPQEVQGLARWAAARAAQGPQR